MNEHQHDTVSEVLASEAAISRVVMPQAGEIQRAYLAPCGAAVGSPQATLIGGYRGRRASLHTLNETDHPDVSHGHFDDIGRQRAA